MKEKKCMCAYVCIYDGTNLRAQYAVFPSLLFVRGATFEQSAGGSPAVRI